MVSQPSVRLPDTYHYGAASIESSTDFTQPLDRWALEVGRCAGSTVASVSFGGNLGNRSESTRQSSHDDLRDTSTLRVYTLVVLYKDGCPNMQS